jgi:Flp pilus assembly protein TadD
MMGSDSSITVERKYTIGAGVLLFCLAVLVFANVFKNDFVGYDDQNLLQTNQMIRSLSAGNIAEMFVPRQRGNYQPMRTLSYAVDVAIWGVRPFGFQLSNIILHGITVILVWCLIRKLVPDTPALLAAMLFAVHPIHVESVAWMSARKDVLALAFFLAAILLHEKAESDHKGALYLVSLFFGLLAYLSKLTAVALPPCILLFEICRDGWPDAAEWRRKILKLLPHILLACMVVGLNFAGFGTVSSHGDALAGMEQMQGGVARDIRLSMPLVVCRYVGLLFVPVRLSTHYDITRVSSFLDPRFFIPLACIAGLIAGGLMCFVSGRRRVAFCIGWFVITFLPTSNIVPTAAMMSDRYMHIPSVGFAVMCAITVDYLVRSSSGTEHRSRRKLNLVPLIVILLLFSILTIRRNTDWHDTATLFKRTLRVNPQSVDAHVALGAMYDREGDYESAIRMYQAGLNIDPDHYRLLFNLGMAYMKKGWLHQAIQTLEKSRAANPEFAATRFNLALAYHQQKRYEEAIAEHRETLRLRPDLAVSHGDLGRIYRKTNKLDLALAELNTALELQPDLVPALIDRAALFRRLGRPEDAEKDLRRLESLGVDAEHLRTKTP